MARIRRNRACRAPGVAHAGPVGRETGGGPLRELMLARSDIWEVDPRRLDLSEERRGGDNTLKIFVCGRLDERGTELTVDEPIRLL
jgi:hypothetical protein